MSSPPFSFGSTSPIPHRLKLWLVSVRGQKLNPN